MKSPGVRWAFVAVAALALLAVAAQPRLLAFVAAHSADGHTLLGTYAVDDLAGAQTPKTGGRLTSGVDAVLQVPGVPGSVKGPNGQPGWIELTSYDFQALGSNTRQTSWKFSFTKNLDATSPIFTQHFQTGTPFQGASIVAVMQLIHAAEKPVIEFEFDGAVPVNDSMATGNSGI
ncbi:MAG: hypothetical protein JO175_05315, partial [Candidatus Eremiobacteraeota bacterium]|nr:hypothetical protein [Candidatus Eremiobacteraeota bacterium]